MFDETPTSEEVSGQDEHDVIDLDTPFRLTEAGMIDMLRRLQTLVHAELDSTKGGSDDPESSDDVEFA